MDKKINLPKNDFIDGDDVEGHKAGNTPSDDMWAMNKPTEDKLGSGVADDVEGHKAGNTPDDVFAANKPTEDKLGSGLADDVEGHRLPGTPDDFTVLPAPPAIGLRRTPGHGGEAIGDDHDVDGVVRQ